VNGILVPKNKGDTRSIIIQPASISVQVSPSAHDKSEPFVHVGSGQIAGSMPKQFEARETPVMSISANNPNIMASLTIFPDKR
jgi:hypothetical protein